MLGFVKVVKLADPAVCYRPLIDKLQRLFEIGVARRCEVLLQHLSFQNHFLSLVDLLLFAKVLFVQFLRQTKPASSTFKTCTSKYYEPRVVSLTMFSEIMKGD